MIELSDGAKVKEEYYNRVEEAIKDDRFVSAEDAISFIYQVYNEVVEVYKLDFKVCKYTKDQFITAFEKMYEQMRNEVFELGTYQYVRAVQEIIENPDVDIMEFLYNLPESGVWSSFARAWYTTIKDLRIKICQ